MKASRLIEVRPRVLMAGVSLAMAIGLFGATGSANAGTYVVNVCDDSHINDSVFVKRTATSASVYANASCTALENSAQGYSMGYGMTVASSIKSPANPNDAGGFADGGLTATAPGGASFSSITANLRIYSSFPVSGSGGWASGLYDDGSSPKWVQCGALSNCTWNYEEAQPIVNSQSLSTSKITLLIICSRTTCLRTGPGRWGIAVMRDVKLTVSDGSSPSVTSLNAPGDWFEGAGAISFNAADNVGVRSLGVDAAGGAAPPLTTPSCDSHSLIPCPQSPSYGQSVDTTRLPDGINTLTAFAIDSAGNRAEQPFQLKVDNTAPSAPTVTSVTPGAPLAGQATFNVAFTEVTPDAGSPIAGYDVRMCKVSADHPCETYTLGSERTLAPKSSADWTVEVRARDTLRSGAWSSPKRFSSRVVDPPADRDHDGVIDKKDRCPTRQGTLATGCPAITAKVSRSKVTVGTKVLYYQVGVTQATPNSELKVKLQCAKPCRVLRHHKLLYRLKDGFKRVNVSITRKGYEGVRYTLAEGTSDDFDGGWSSKCSLIPGTWSLVPGKCQIR